MNSPHDVYMLIGVVVGLLLGTWWLIDGWWVFAALCYSVSMWLMKLWLLKGRTT